jgi:selenocysteine lyase/cysteine desulfurase
MRNSLMHALGIGGTIRLSLALYNTLKEVRWLGIIPEKITLF